VRRAAPAVQAAALDRAGRRAAEDRDGQDPALQASRPSAGVSRHRVRFSLNGAPVDVTVPAERLLVDLLRDDLRKTGTKDGCSVGACGLCTVLVDGVPLLACMLLSTQVDGTAASTVERLSATHTACVIREV